MEFAEASRGHEGVGSDKIKGGVGMGSSRGTGEDRVEGPAV